MSERNLYSVLGVSRNADTSEIRSAYKQLAKEHHPDKGGDPEKFKELSQAHEILSDDGKRKHYDMTGSISEQQGPGGPFGFHGGGGFGMPEVFSQMFGGMFPGGHGGMPGMPGMPGGGHGVRKQEGKSPGKNQDIALRISDYYHGRQVNIKIGRQSFCKTCKGSGGASTATCDTCGGLGQVRQVVSMGPIQMVSQSACPNCGGKGQKTVGQCGGCNGRCVLHEEKSLDVKIEPGMLSGNTIVFSGMCSDHPGFTEAGDVTFILREAEEEDSNAASWSREGTRLKTATTVSLAEALLGTTKVLRGHPGFPDGVAIEMPPGIQNMWTGVFPNLGMPIRGTPKFGDAHITVLVVPTPAEIESLKTNMDVFKNSLPSITSVPDGSYLKHSGKWNV